MFGDKNQGAFPTRSRETVPKIRQHRLNISLWNQSLWIWLC